MDWDGTTDVKNTEAQDAFENWLSEEGYEPAVEVCPRDDGEFLFAEHAYDLISDFLANNLQFEDKMDELTFFANELGEVSNWMKVEQDNEEKSFAPNLTPDQKTLMNTLMGTLADWQDWDIKDNHATFEAPGPFCCLVRIIDDKLEITEPIFGWPLSEKVLKTFDVNDPELVGKFAVFAQDRDFWFPIAMQGAF